MNATPIFDSSTWGSELLQVGAGRNQFSPEKSVEIEFQKLKQSLHGEIVESLDLVASEISDADLQKQLGPFIDEFLASTDRVINSDWRKRLGQELPAEMFGIGPLEPLMRDPAISDVLVNDPHRVFIEKHGVLSESSIVFADEAHLLRIIQRIATSVGRRIDEVCPLVDARLPDGSRVNAVIAPLALDGPKLSIRRFGRKFLSLSSLVENRTMSREVASFLEKAVQARLSIVISGGTGSGKTTLLNALSAAIPPNERIVTIEDSAELLLNHPHVARLETRPANSEGNGEFTQRDLVRNSLRMRPDRIIVGEVRGGEALDMLQAMNTGHDGSLTTIHANDTFDAITRLEMMIAMTGFELPHRVVQSYLISGIDLVVQVSRLQNGKRRVLRISELTQADSENSRSTDIQLTDVFNLKAEETFSNLRADECLMKRNFIGDGTSGEADV